MCVCYQHLKRQVASNWLKPTFGNYMCVMQTYKQTASSSIKHMNTHINRMFDTTSKTQNNLWSPIWTQSEPTKTEKSIQKALTLTWNLCRTYNSLCATHIDICTVLKHPYNSYNNNVIHIYIYTYLHLHDTYRVNYKGLEYVCVYT